jgi:hypothetical protein
VIIDVAAMEFATKFKDSVAAMIIGDLECPILVGTVLIGFVLLRSLGLTFQTLLEHAMVILNVLALVSVIVSPANVSALKDSRGKHASAEHARMAAQAMALVNLLKRLGMALLNSTIVIAIFTNHSRRSRIMGGTSGR